MENKRILVTGGAGFIGSNVCNLLYKYGYDIKIFDYLTYASDIKRLNNNLFDRVLRVDITNKTDLKRAFDFFYGQDWLPHVIIHLAAETHVDRSLVEASKFILTNILGTYNMIHFSTACSANRFVYISTDEVYGETKEGEFLETDQLNPLNPYSVSKASADMMCRAYYRTHGFPCVIVRPCNNYGPRQNKEKFIPHSLETENIEVYGDGSQVREWLFVEDCAEAIIRVMGTDGNGEVYNVGSGVEMTNLELARKISILTKKPIKFVNDRPGHDFRYKLNSDKIKEKTDWRPMMNFDNGLLLTLASLSNSD